ncbi:hypothetical protein [Oricola sp.]|uniref:hypothetical protein n=1 Tax=Oricola sp. TaxID=1979950 RepID=UPI0025D110EC|nr:hypothetical protein [Oricola sp.]MCI5078742.1 hypothetical protein [Oricola sp.]
MATYNKINDFVEHLAEGVHNLGADTLTVALSNTAPGSESSNPATDGNGVLANVTQVAYTYCSARAITISTSAQASGTYKLTLADLTLTASGGSVGPFRYIYIYNDTPTSPADALIGYYDYGSAITLADGESLTIDFSAVNGVLQIA